MRMATSSDFYSLVCAIDFGTTFSGYAYSPKVEYQYDPLNITVPKWENAPPSILISYKTPTTLLLDKDKNFVAFGYEAEYTYADLAEEKENEDYFYIRRFKMFLYDTLRKQQRLTKDTTIKDITGKKEVQAIDVFKHAIKYFRNQMLETITKKGLGVQEANIRWVLTVPAIWTDTAKQFMIAAAEGAGISKSKLTIALEPEAASIYCNSLPLSKFEDGSGLGGFEVGQKYLVLDAGGGTVDITVHEVMKDKTLKELEKASGGDWGGNYVDNRFKDFLTSVVTSEVMEGFHLRHTGEYIELFQDFENIKRKTDPTQQSRVTMRMPGSLRELYEKIRNKSLKKAIEESKNSESIKWEGDKLRFTIAFYEDLFLSACAGIIRHIHDLLDKPKMKGTNTILMVGGFSESPILQARIKQEFRDCKIVIPNEPSLAVLKGAVNFGHNPCVISERIAKYWYGIASLQKFNPKLHSYEKKRSDLCDDIFEICVRRGDIFKLHDSQTKGPYETNRDDQKEMEFDIYVSDSDLPPMYVTDEECYYLGTLTVELPKTKKGEKRSVFLNFIFGGTVLHVQATINADEVAKAMFDFLDKNSN
uniref:Heat shock 70 kDa protein 12A-like n=1 Tax=Crassostrea virginica TaxID=6565 RepID=A0A8B8AMV1_CRAVI|nr:heat shock 70 kDa protein 12A-like [Crassostrea virginica]